LGELSRAIVDAAPVTAIVAVAGAAAFGVVGQLLDWRYLQDAGASRLVLAAIVLLAVGVFVIARGRAPGLEDGGSGMGAVMASAPGLVLLVYAVAMQFVPLPHRVEWFLGGDHVRHLVFTSQEAYVGNLDYDVNSYPRAWHSLIATMWKATGGEHDAEGFLSLVSLMATAVWCLYALFTMATGQLAYTLARRLGLVTPVAALGGVVAGSLTLWPTYFSNYQALGFENSIVASLALAVCGLEILRDSSSMRACVATSAAVVVIAHAWQLLLPTALLALAFSLWSTAAARGRVPWRTIAIALSALAAASPGVVSVVSEIGLSHGTDAGVDAPLPVLLMPAAFAATIVVTWWRRKDAAVLTLALMVTGTAVTALALAAVLGIPVTQYYPSKVLWSASALALPALGVVLARGAHVVWLLPSPSRVVGRSGVLGLATIGFGLCAAVPASALMSWETVDGRRVLDAVASPRAGSAQVVWLPGAESELSDQTIARILLDFYRVREAAAFLPQAPLNVEQECEVLEGSDRPTVLSSAPLAQVRARYGCSSGLRVVLVQARH
jgi:hypothetical protein